MKSLDAKLKKVILTFLSLLLLTTVLVIVKVNKIANMNVCGEGCEVTVEGEFYGEDDVKITTANGPGEPATLNYQSLNNIIGYNDLVYGLSGLRSMYKEYLFTLDSADGKGANIKTTINVALQDYLYNNLLDFEGSIVVMEKNGAIRALASKGPVEMDISSHESLDHYMKVSSQIEGSQLLRGTEDNDPPGSTLKALTAIAAAEKVRKERLGNDYFLYDDSGEYVIPGFKVNNFDNAIYKDLNLNEAMMFSSNTYFADLGVRTGSEMLLEVANNFLFNQSIKLDFTTLYSNYTIPTLSPAECAANSMGQGTVTTTPVHLAMIYNMIQNNGKMYEPYMIEKINSSDGKLLYKHDEAILSEYGHKQSYETVKKALSTAATSYGLMWQNNDVYGKTGTAECPNGIHKYLVLFNEQYTVVISENNANDVYDDLTDIGQGVIDFLQLMNY